MRFRCLGLAVAPLPSCLASLCAGYVVPRFTMAALVRFRLPFAFSVCRLVSRRCRTIASMASIASICSTIKALTAAPLHLQRSSPCLSRANFRPFRPQPLDAPAHRFVRHLQRVRRVSGFVISTQTHRHIPPNRVRFLRTSLSPPVALHLASRQRSYLRLRSYGFLRHGLSPCCSRAFTGARKMRFAIPPNAAST